VLTVPGAAQVRGLIYLDRDGSSTFSAGDTVLTNAKLKLIALGTVDTVKQATSDTGRLFAGNPVNFSFVPVPVGSYRVGVDTLTIPHDSMRITQFDSLVTVASGDTAFVRIGVAFPTTTPTGVRALPLRTKVFVVGVALTDATTFGDNTTSFADPAGAIRVTQLKVNTFITTGDSDRVLGTVDTLGGQHVLRFFSLSQLNVLAVTDSTVLTVGTAKTANGGAADAGLVKLSGRVVIIDTLTGPAGLIMHVTDTTGSPTDTLEVHLDTAAQFDTTAIKRDGAMARWHLRGILLPSTVPGRWLLKPRSPADQTP
jgi:hypothetical protein